MLQKIIIRNYAIIDHLTVEPDAHLNTLTGETGAGKSIILGALSLILGERADISVLINKEEKCIVEAYFDVSGNDMFQAFLQQEEIDEEEVCIIRREISASGKSRAFVNDTPVTLGVLNKLTSHLVDLHQQFGHLALQEDSFQMDVVDAVAKSQKQLTEYKQAYQTYKVIQARLDNLLQQQAQWQKEADYKQFLFDELHIAGFKENEIEDAAAQLKQLSHAERIMNVLANAANALQEGEQPLVNELKKMSQQLLSVSDVFPEAAVLQERLQASYAELQDIGHELQHAQSKIAIDPAAMEEWQQRIDMGYKLLKKHGLQSTSELLALQNQLELELQQSLNLSDSIAQTKNEADELYCLLKAIGEKLTAQRQEAAPKMANEVTALLKLVGMPNAVLKIELLKQETPSVNGWDKVQFLLDANKSGRFLPVYKAASGGEMSRIMLCIKSLTAQAMQMPTLIFDEVDTGISGEAAKQVGLLLKSLGQYHQVICITHQPQVAAKGSRHFFVYKQPDAQGKIQTRVKVLHSDSRIEAIAKMIGGEQPSEAALQNARELVAM